MVLDEDATRHEHTRLEVGVIGPVERDGIVGDGAFEAVGFLSPLLEMKLNIAALAFLRSGNIEEFNQLRGQYPSWRPNFSKFEKSFFTPAVVSSADLRGAMFEEMDLAGVNFSSVNLERTSFIASDLKGVNFSNSTLSSAQISSADLTGANLSGAIMVDADLSDSKLRLANLVGTNLKDASIDTGYFKSIVARDGSVVLVLDLLGIKYDDSTTFPMEINCKVEHGVGFYIGGERLNAQQVLDLS